PSVLVIRIEHQLLSTDLLSIICQSFFNGVAITSGRSQDVVIFDFASLKLNIIARQFSTSKKFWFPFIYFQYKIIHFGKFLQTFVSSRIQLNFHGVVLRTW